MFLANEVLTAIWDARHLDGRDLSATEKLVLVRIADYTLRSSGVAWIAVTRLAADCCLSKTGLLGVLARLLLRRVCPRHDVGGRDDEDECRICHAALETRGCLEVTEAATGTRARRYRLRLDRLSGQAALPLASGPSGQAACPQDDPLAVNELDHSAVNPLDHKGKSASGQVGEASGQPGDASGQAGEPSGQAACPDPESRKYRSGVQIRKDQDLPALSRRAVHTQKTIDDGEAPGEDRPADAADEGDRMATALHDRAGRDRSGADDRRRGMEGADQGSNRSARIREPAEHGANPSGDERRRGGVGTDQGTTPDRRRNAAAAVAVLDPEPADADEGGSSGLRPGGTTARLDLEAVKERIRKLPPLTRRPDTTPRHRRRAVGPRREQNE